MNFTESQIKTIQVMAQRLGPLCDIDFMVAKNQNLLVEAIEYAGWEEIKSSTINSIEFTRFEIFQTKVEGYVRVHLLRYDRNVSYKTICVLKRQYEDRIMQLELRLQSLQKPYTQKNLRNFLRRFN